jgi:hypothetical protein
MKGRAAIAAASLALALMSAGISGATLFATSSGAATLSCPNFTDTDVPTPPAGQTGYLFIGTSISTPSSSITVTFHVDGGADQQQTFPGDQQGNGAFHYIVNLPQGAVVTDATVTGATGNTTITVSGCLNGPELPSGGTVTPPGPSVAGETVTRAPVAAAVPGAARFTG